MSRFENRTLTLRDVSEASGVSEMTVSRVLRGRGDVSQATREKVLQAAKSCLLYTSPSPRDLSTSRMPSSA